MIIRKIEDGVVKETNTEALAPAKKGNVDFKTLCELVANIVWETLSKEEAAARTLMKIEELNSKSHIHETSSYEHKYLNHLASTCKDFLDPEAE